VNTPWKINGDPISADPELPEGGSEAKFRLLRAAVLLFAEKGYGGVGIRKISTEACWNSSLISYHFGGKAGIQRAAITLACRQVQRLASYFPILPGKGEPDARPRAAAALRETIRIILRFGLPESSDADREGAFGRALLVLFLREMASPVPETEGMVLEASSPFVDYMNRCVQAIRPDLDAPTTLRTGMSIYGQILFLLSYQGIVPYFGEEGLAETGLSSLVDHVSAFSLRGLHPA